MVDGVFWVKIGFCVFAFCEAFFAGIFPTLSKTCRESPKILGIANSFAAGVFMGIAFLHILPEEIEIWNGLWASYGCNVDHVLPLPTILLVCGYTLILIIDKVLFDTHSLFAHEDEHGHAETGRHSAHSDNAEEKFRENLKASFAKIEKARNSHPDVDVSHEIEEENKKVKQEVQDYLNPHNQKV